jgi:hypothetical protein
MLSPLLGDPQLSATFVQAADAKDSRQGPTRFLDELVHDDGIQLARQRPRG